MRDASNKNRHAKGSPSVLSWAETESRPAQQSRRNEGETAFAQGVVDLRGDINWRIRVLRRVMSVFHVGKSDNERRPIRYGMDGGRRGRECRRGRAGGGSRSNSLVCSSVPRRGACKPRRQEMSRSRRKRRRNLVDRGNRWAHPAQCDSFQQGVAQSGLLQGLGPH